MLVQRRVHLGIPMMGERVKLLGLDFGTTTSSAVVAAAQLARNSVTGRTDLSEVRESFRSDLVLTPLKDDKLDITALEGHLDEWLRLGDVRAAELFGGGALLTGLTAQRGNADRLVALIKKKLNDALIASADDPCLESWLAFHGSCGTLSRAHPDRLVLNLDIGGGTTNLALGRNGEVLQTGCYFVGARHVQVEPGTYRIVRMSEQARALLEHLGVAKQTGAELARSEVNAFLDFQIGLLVAASTGGARDEPISRLHCQVAFHMPPTSERPLITFSGGVGELIYNFLRDGAWPTTTCFGDLGVDLAQRIVACPDWGDEWRSVRPASGGRATVYGLLRHSTEIAGSTVFLPNPAMLPLHDMPIVGEVSEQSDTAHIAALLDLARRSPRGGCVQVSLAEPSAAAVRRLADIVSAELVRLGFPAAHPLVFLVEQNVGKLLGQTLTRWGQSPRNLIVLDEIAGRDAQFACIGAPRQQVIPVSVYGLRE